jgi:hypothetical protein
MFHHNLAPDFVARNVRPFHPTHLASRNFGLGLPPDIPRRPLVKSPPKVYWPDVALAFTAGLICVLLGVIGTVWLFGG